ncbi:MAG: diguanylate cyclase [Microvirga sp.]
MPNGRGLDLQACERERIHVPGSVQAHGILLVVDTATDAILQAAGDASSLLGHSAPLVGAFVREVLGLSLDTLLGRADTALLTEPIYLGTIRPDAAREELTVTAHQVLGAAIIEIEASRGASTAAATLAGIRSMNERIGGASELLAACRIAASEVRRVSGYDRVMIYQFLADGSGSVIVEDKADELPPFLNHRFPASDIPKQAHDLYRRNPIRVIPDIAYTPAPLVPAICPATGQPLDMSHCVLRAISPVHLQYLKNMRVGASMSVSLLREGELWGLISCHNTTAMLVSYEAREACRHVGQVLSQQIQAREQSEHYRRALELHVAREKVLSALRMADDPGAALLGICAELEAVVPSHGVAIAWRGTITRTGQGPSEAALAELAGWLSNRLSESDFFVSECLSEHYADAEAFTTTASGLLSIVLPGDEPIIVMWLRAEQREEIKWAGNPHEPLEPGSGRGAPSPRKSFALWEETVWGRSRSWAPVEIESARTFCLQATFILQQQTIRALNGHLQEANERLVILASTDGLTGVANRRTFDDRLRGEWGRAGRDGRSLSLLVLDLDFFKQYNDHFGHGAGDECLKRVAHLLRTGRRAIDLPARLGGEEFAVLLPDTDLEGATAVAESVRSRIADLCIQHPKSPMGIVTASIGVTAATPGTADSGQDLVEAADRALYEAKRAGRNRVVSATDERLLS